MFRSPLDFLESWAPFRIDALGLVTMIGAEEVSKSVGRLVRSRYTEYLPLLGAYLIAGNQFTEAAPGYTLYNISDAVTTNRLSGWFSKWLSFQDFNDSTTVLEWTVLAKSRNGDQSGTIVPFVVGCLFNGGLFLVSGLTGDWWGLSNACSMLLASLVRAILLRQNTIGIDAECVRACVEVLSQDLEEQVKVLVTLPDGKLVTLYAPRGLVKEGFTKKPTPPDPRVYLWTRGFGWILFGIHAIALGQSNLVSQIYSVLLLVLSSWAAAKGLGCNESEIGQHLVVKKLDQHDPPYPDRRIWAYVSLEVSEKEYESLLDSGLLPRRTNTLWWQDFAEAQAFHRERKKKKESQDVA